MVQLYVIFIRTINRISAAAVDELEWTGKALLQHKDYCPPQSVICFLLMLCLL